MLKKITNLKSKISRFRGYKRSYYHIEKIWKIKRLTSIWIYIYGLKIWKNVKYFTKKSLLLIYIVSPFIVEVVSVVVFLVVSSVEGFNVDDSKVVSLPSFSEIIMLCFISTKSFHFDVLIKWMFSLLRFIALNKKFRCRACYLNSLLKMNYC